MSGIKFRKQLHIVRVFVSKMDKLGCFFKGVMCRYPYICAMIRYFHVLNCIVVAWCQGLGVLYFNFNGFMSNGLFRVSGTAIRGRE